MKEQKYKTFDCEYMRRSDNPCYLYIHICANDGWGYSGGKYMFLYDSSAQCLRCSLDDREMTDFRMGIVKDSYKEVSSTTLVDDVEIEEMLSAKEIQSNYYDSGSYMIFLKSGNRTRYISIDKQELSSYPQFLWIIKQIDTQL